MEELIELKSGWLEVVEAGLAQPYMCKLKQFLAVRKNAGATIFPPQSQWFNALNSTPFNQVRVVIIGQDPYHGAGQAHGLCFSVLPGVKTPPSLQNIYKELQADLGCAIPNHGNLQHWANQGVLMLNSVLTVEQGQPASHQNQGWEQFTDQIIAKLNTDRENLVFILWGAYAQRKGEVIDSSRHLVLKTAHPSPFAARKGFFGCKHFSQTNTYLKQHGKQEVDWCVQNLPTTSSR